MLQYFFYTATGEFSGKTPIQVAEGFGALLANPTTQIINTVLIAGSAFLILSFSLRGGLERVIKWMMMALIVIMVIVAVNNLFMDGVKDGLRFYLLPDFSKISWDVVVAAMNQAFFTLSLGIGAEATLIKTTP